jgi:hypothetical protein
LYALGVTKPEKNMYYASWIQKSEDANRQIPMGGKGDGI